MIQVLKQLLRRRQKPGGGRLILHAGMHKTGTSAIQDYLFHHLEHPEFAYFHDGVPNSSLIMLQAFKHDFAELSNIRAAKISPGRAARIRQRARERVEKKLGSLDAPTVVLSAESLCMFKPEEAADLREMAARHFERIDVVLYLRDVWERVESAFQERLKTRYTSLTKPIPANFQRYEQVFDEVFGADRVTYRRFAPREYPGGTVVADFLDFAGIPHGQLPREQVNTSLSQPAVQLLYLYRKFYPVYADGDRILIEKLAGLRGRKFSVHRALVEEVVREDPNSREWLMRRAGISLWETHRESDGGAIRDESDLLDIPAEALAWLGEQSPAKAGQTFSPSSDPRQLADALRLLSRQPLVK